MSASDSHQAGEYGSLLRRLRLRAGMSQEELARRSGISQRGLRKIETQATRPRASTVKLLAEALQLDDEQRDALIRTTLAPAPAPAAASVKPAQLPATTAAFLGRDTTVAAIETAAHTRPVIVVDGMAGIGKTTLATYCARRFGDRYPDGRLFIDLHGFDPDVPPVDPTVALDRLLRDLGVDSERIPHELDELAALYRSVLSGRRMVIVLDNAACEAQLRPLLPGDPGNLVLVTSRNKLPELEDATFVPLPTLDRADAVRLFRRVAAMDDDSQAVAEIVEHCGRLPLAIRIAASRLSNRPHWTPEWLLDRLRASAGPLAELSHGDDGVAVAFELSYADLSDELVRFFRALGAGFGTDFDGHAASALAGIPTARAEVLLEQLLDANLLLAAESPGRFRFHNLIRQFARDKTRAEETEAERERMRLRLLDRYRAIGQHAANVFNPHFTPEYTPAAGVELPPLQTTDQAQQWYDAEYRNLILSVDHAFDQHDDRHALDIAFTLWTYLGRTDRDAEQAHVYRCAVAAARRSGDEAAEARALNVLGLTLPQLGDIAEAMRCLQRSLEIRRRIGDPKEVAATLNSLGWLVDRVGTLGDAIALYRECAALAGQTGHEALQAMAYSSLTDCLRRAGEFAEAEELVTRAIAIHTRVGHEFELARARYNLAQLLRTVGKPLEAYEIHAEVLDYCRDHAGGTPLAHIMCGMADVLRDLGDLEESLALLGQALERIRDQGSFAEVDCLNGLGHTHEAMRDHAAARDAHRRALTVAERLQQADGRAVALHGLARATAALGDLPQALDHATEALEACESIGLRDSAAIRRFIDELTVSLAR